MLAYTHTYIDSCIYIIIYVKHAYWQQGEATRYIVCIVYLLACPDLQRVSWV